MDNISRVARLPALPARPVTAPTAAAYPINAPNAYCQRAASKLIALMMTKRRERGKLSGSRISVSFHGRRISFSFEEHLGEELLGPADCPEEM